MMQSILSNLAVILLSHLVVTTFIVYRERFSKFIIQFTIICFMSLTIISMFYLPIQFGDYRFDLRLIPLLMLALFSGWRITLPVLIIASIWRFFLGGEGAFPGVVFGMMLPTFFALLYVKVFKNPNRVWDKILLVSICWALSDIPLIFYLQGGEDIIKQIGLLRYSSFVIATFIYYTVIKIENGRIEMKQQLQFLATHDQMTKLLNRQECIRRAEIKHKSNDKNKQSFMVMIDIDHFKHLNDEYGHAIGDYTLKQMAVIFKKFESETVQVARYGGEEFLLWLSVPNEQKGIQLVESIQQDIRETKFQVAQDDFIPVTVSMGMALWQQGTSIHDSIKEADRKLYQAKDNGRNQLVV